MLWQRVLTALILIPLVLWAVMGLSSLYFALLCAGFLSLGAYEWAALCHLSRFLKSVYCVVFLGVLGLLIWWDNLSVLVLGSLFWLCPLYWVITYQGVAPGIFKNNMFKACLGILILSFAGFGLIFVHQLSMGKLLIILLFILVWSTDTFAYFIGRRWGHKPLSPLISPKKTQAGFWGGLLGSMLIALSVGIISKESMFKPLPVWLGIAFIVILLAVLGDLFESLMKRISEVKDSGNLLPGHGGVLDRIDSLLAAAPFYALCLAGLQRI